MKIEGTWEEIAALGSSLAGQRFRLISLPDEDDDPNDEDEQDPPMTWEEWEKERDEIAAELAKVWPAGLTAVDAVREQRRY